ncbi:hypothetical protein AGOR_G00140610 [Albula goreensis]|uniref:Uncharacterized protein n=1 Tax=Albula goreensis TaxID=1534307 RepID=A0A8T3DC21_9TELE|nr:hypothetical protein AGOR_G00140610 [Albula goreensis]
MQDFLSTEVKNQVKEWRHEEHLVQQNGATNKGLCVCNYSKICFEYLFMLYLCMKIEMRMLFWISCFSGNGHLLVLQCDHFFIEAPKKERAEKTHVLESCLFVDLFVPGPVGLCIIVSVLK